MSAFLHKGFQVRPIRKTAKTAARETLLTIHQGRMQEMMDSSGNLDISATALYYLRNGPLLMRYHSLISSDTPVKNIRTVDESTTSIKSIANFFHTTSDPITKEDLSENHIASFYEVSKLKKHEIYDLYQANINPSFIPEKFCKKNDDIRVCSSCGADATLIPNDAILFCEACGWEEKILIDVDLPGMKEQSKDSSYFNYRKINHFNEWLAQFQAKETTDIPSEVYDLILLELRKEKRRNIAELKPKTLREILKRLNMNKYYEHIPHIMNRLNGIPPPRLSPETEEVLRGMFRDIQTPFMKYCPPWRKNFLSYSYVLHKFCKILGKDEFLSCFPLLKSREKLYEMDKVWKMICEDLGWEFHRSI